MDTTKAITHVSLCAGYGGIDIGLSRAIPSLRTVAFSEIEAFACANLVSKMEAGLLDAAPIWTNLKTFPWSEFRDRVDLLSGGYPCQPFSSAGKRLGTEDPRHLWPYIADGIRAMRPRVCFFENVEGHISLGLREVISELEGIGYKVAWGIFSAREVGAPHQRKRVFILAMANNGGEGLQGNISRLLVSSRRQEQGGSVGSCCGSSGDRELADSNGAGSWEDRESSEPRADGIKQPPSDPWGSAEGEVRQEHAWPSHHGKLADSGACTDTEAGHAETDRLPSEYWEAVCARQSGGADADAWPSRPGQPQHEWEPPRVVGNATHGSNGQHTSEQQGWDTFGRPSAEGVSMGDTENQGCRRLDDEQGEVSSRETRGHLDRASSTMGNGNSINRSAPPEGWQHDRQVGPAGEELGDTEGSRTYGATAPMAGEKHQEEGRESKTGDVGQTAWNDGDGASEECGQTQQPLGRDTDEPPSGMDYAELSVTCDNRTDELRLLGNGVVPATAERAFRTLLAELIR